MSQTPYSPQMQDLCCIAAMLLIHLPGFAHDGAHTPATDVPATDAPAEYRAENPAENYFTNVTLVNQYGERRLFYKDLLENKVVVINTFFTSCEESCPITMGILAQMQAHFSDRMGKDLHMLSITQDPVVDTPAKLKVYADNFKVGLGWQLLTSDQASVEFALQKIGQYVEEKNAHTSIVIIGNEATGLWKKAFVHAGPEELAKIVESVLNDSGR